MENKVTVTIELDGEGNLKINSNTNPVASVKLMADAQGVILADILKNRMTTSETKTQAEVIEQ